MFALKRLMQSLGVTNIDARQDGRCCRPPMAAPLPFNSTIAGIEDADAILIVGSNPRIEASLVNVRIRKRWRVAPPPIALIGEQADLTYPYEYLGAGPETLADWSPAVTASSKSCRAPSVRSSSWGRALSPARTASRSCRSQRSWPEHRRSQGGLERLLGPAHGGLAGRRARSRLRAGRGRTDRSAMAQGGVDVLFNLGADEIDIAPGAFVIYQGTHGDRGAHRADVILPGATYTEKSGTYVNTEGRVQMANRAAFAPGDAREDWAILRALSDVLGHRLPFDSLNALRAEALCRASAFRGARRGHSRPMCGGGRAGAAGIGGSPGRETFVSPVKDFYLTNPIARASGVMAECSALARELRLEAAE